MKFLLADLYMADTFDRMDRKQGTLEEFPYDITHAIWQVEMDPWKYQGGRINVDGILISRYLLSDIPGLKPLGEPTVIIRRGVSGEYDKFEYFPGEYLGYTFLCMSGMQFTNPHAIVSLEKDQISSGAQELPEDMPWSHCEQVQYLNDLSVSFMYLRKEFWIDPSNQHPADVLDRCMPDKYWGLLAYQAKEPLTEGLRLHFKMNEIQLGTILEAGNDAVFHLIPPQAENHTSVFISQESADVVDSSEPSVCTMHCGCEEESYLHVVWSSYGRTFEGHDIMETYLNKYGASEFMLCSRGPLVMHSFRDYKYTLHYVLFLA